MELLGVGERIAEAREAAGLTQQQLADEMEVNLSTVWRWEKQRLIPSGENLAQLAGLLRVTADHLLFGPRKFRKPAVAAS